MTIAIVVPWRAGCPHRERNLAWTLNRYQRAFPDADTRLGACDPDLPFNRGAAILDGARRSDADVLIIADGDCWTDGINAAVEQVANGKPWAVPHLMLCRFDETSTENVLAGGDLDEQEGFSERPYKGFEAGTVLVIRRDVLFDVPPDVRCVGWGQDDEIWSLALRTLVGLPWRGKQPCWHLWHPPQPRKNRAIGHDANLALLRRYRAARRQPDRVRAIVEEAKAVTS